MKYVMFMCLVFFLTAPAAGQVKKLSDGQYQISGTTLSKLDMAAKQYIKCSYATDSIVQQLEILNANRLIKDNLLINQQARISRLSNDLLGEMQEREKLKQENIKLKTEIRIYKNRTLAWRIIGGTAILVGTFFALR